MTYRDHGFEKIDFVLLAWIAVIVVVVGSFKSDIAESGPIITRHITWALLFLAAVRIMHRTQVPLVWRYVIRILAIIAMIPITFLNLGPIITAVHPGTYELELMAIDRWIFGIDPVLYMERWLHPVAVDIFSIAYFSYFTLAFIALPPMLVIKDVATVDRTITSVMLTVFTCYVFYFLVPARSPYLAANVDGLAHAFGYTVPVSGWLVGDAIRGAIDSWDSVQLNAFPSAHAAVATAFVLAVRHKPVLFRILLVNGLMLIFSTLYLRYHYVIDVIVGVALAFATTAIADRMSDHPVETGGAAHEEVP